jgi:hypothetical protein
MQDFDIHASHKDVKVNMSVAINRSGRQTITVSATNVIVKRTRIDIGASNRFMNSSVALHSSGNPCRYLVQRCKEIIGLTDASSSYWSHCRHAVRDTTLPKNPSCVWRWVWPKTELKKTRKEPVLMAATDTATAKGGTQVDLLLVLISMLALPGFDCRRCPDEPNFAQQPPTLQTILARSALLISPSV